MTSTEYWRAVAMRRSIAAAIIGLTAGFLLHMTIAAPPVWIDQIGACTP